VVKATRTLLFLGALGLALLGLSSALFAQIDSRERLFTVFGVAVDERAANAAAARANAIAKAEVAAFERLLQRLIGEGDFERFSLPDGARATDYVRGIEVETERNSQVRYIATLNITFDEAKVEELLGRQSIAYVSIAPKLTLVFPLLWHDGGWLLWQEANVFREQWSKDLLLNHIMAYQLPRGDLTERTGITPDLLMAGRQKDRLVAVMAEYRAEDILVVAARLRRGAYGETSGLTMELSYPLTGSAGEVVEEPRRFPETDEELMARTIARLIDSQDQVWKAGTLIHFGSVTELLLIVPAEDTAAWAETLARLKATPVVQNVEVRRLAMPVSYVIINFIGSTDQLALALAQKGLILLESAEGWVVLREESKGLIADRG